MPADRGLAVNRGMNALRCCPGDLEHGISPLKRFVVVEFDDLGGPLVALLDDQAALSHSFNEVAQTAWFTGD